MCRGCKTKQKASPISIVTKIEHYISAAKSGAFQISYDF